METTTSTIPGTLTEALISFLDTSRDSLQKGTELAVDGAGKALDFASVQVPLVLQELVTVRRVECGFYLALGIIGVIVTTIVAIKTFKQLVKEKEKMIEKRGEYYCDVSGYVMGEIFIWFIIVMPALPLLLNIRTLLIPFFAPRIYLIEYTIALIDKVQ